MEVNNPQVTAGCVTVTCSQEPGLVPMEARHGGKTWWLQERSQRSRFLDKIGSRGRVVGGTRWCGRVLEVDSVNSSEGHLCRPARCGKERQLKVTGGRKCDATTKELYKVNPLLRKATRHPISVQGKGLQGMAAERRTLQLEPGIPADSKEAADVGGLGGRDPAAADPPQDPEGKSGSV